MEALRWTLVWALLKRAAGGEAGLTVVNMCQPLPMSCSCTPAPFSGSPA